MANYFQFNTETGVVTADTSTVQADVQSEFKTALGVDLDLSPQTPQGRLIDAETMARTNVLNYTANIANQINPDEAGGVFLASIGSLMGISPYQATPTIVNNARIYGVNGTVVPAGMQIYDTQSNYYQLTTNVTINQTDTSTTPATYYAVATFQALNPGPIAAVAGTQWFLNAPVPTGVNNVTNPIAGTPGAAAETDVAFRQRRKATLAILSSGTVRSTQSLVSNTAGFRSMALRENNTSSPMQIGTYVDNTSTSYPVNIAPNSLWVCVQNGPTQADVASAMLASKSGGCAWSVPTATDSAKTIMGQVITVPVAEPASGQTYTVVYTTPNVINCVCDVYYDTTQAYGNFEPELAIQDAVTKYQNGQINSDPGLIIGRNLSADALAGAISSLYPGLYIYNVTVTGKGLSAVAEIPASIWEVLTIPTGAINIHKRS